MKYDFGTNEYILNRVDGSEYRWDDLFPGIVQDFWTNDPTVWDLENKVTWDELAPSLQELIIRKIRFSDLHETLQNRIIQDENNIAANTTAINNEIAERIRANAVLQDQIDDLKRRMEAAEKRITDLELRMNEAERQIGLLWDEVRHLWEKLGQTEDRVEYLEGKVEEIEDTLREMGTIDGGGFWIKFPNGIIIQAGTDLLEESGIWEVRNFHIPFPNKCVAMVGSDVDAYTQDPAMPFFNINCGSNWLDEGNPPFDPRTQFGIESLHVHSSTGPLLAGWIAFGF